MARPSLAEKDILNPSEAIEYFVLSRRKFYDLLNNTDGEDFLAYYGERKLILRVAFERYLRNHPELRRRYNGKGRKRTDKAGLQTQSIKTGRKHKSRRKILMLYHKS